MSSIITKLLPHIKHIHLVSTSRGSRTKPVTIMACFKFKNGVHVTKHVPQHMMNTVVNEAKAKNVEVRGA